MKRLALFDVDATLVEGTRAHKAAFSKAFRELYGVDVDLKNKSYHGRTDQWIMIDILKGAGLDEKTIRSKMGECMSAMADFYDEFVGGDEIVVLDGVPGLLEDLDKKGVLMGLVTGNLERIARAKLGRVGLAHYFGVGGFGSDDINRTKMVKLAVKRAEERFGLLFDKSNVFLFGDTPFDIGAGKEAGVKTVGVATGIFSKPQLEAAGADFVFEDLKDKDKILDIILSD